MECVVPFVNAILVLLINVSILNDYFGLEINSVAAYLLVKHFSKAFLKSSMGNLFLFFFIHVEFLIFSGVYYSCA